MRSQARTFQYYLIAVSVIAAVVWVSELYHTQWSLNTALQLLIFGVLAIASESLPVIMSNGSRVSVGFAMYFSSLILFPPGVSFSVAAVGGLLVFRNTKLHNRVFNGAQFVLSLKMASLVTALFNVSGFHPCLRFFLVYFLAAFVYIVVNMVTISFALSFMQGKSAWGIWLSSISWSMPNFLALALLGFLIALIFNNYGPLGLVFLTIPLLLSRFTFQRYIDMRTNYFSTIEALVKAIEAKDKYTRGHSDRVSRYSVAIAGALGLRDEKIEAVKFCAILHDLGKIGISENILNKEDKLLDREWETIRDHPVIGENIIKDIRFLYKIGPGVRHHHEKYDGGGYPDGLRGENIPLEARIIAVADTYDAMTTDRVYRKRKSQLEALAEMRRVAGSQLDPTLVNIFCKVVPAEAACEGAVGHLEQGMEASCEV